MNSVAETCPGCGSDDLTPVVEILDMPVHVGSLWPTAEQAKACPKGDIALHHCGSCQLLYNTTFDPKPLEYTQDYDNSLESSKVFMNFATSRAQGLIDAYDLHDKTVVEIGCGKGEFIGLLCKLGPNNGIGFDTTYDDTKPNPAPDRLKFVKAHYTAEQTDHGAALVVSRHVFEHIPQPMPFLEMLRESLGDESDTKIYFEVPEVLFILRDLSIWDIIYEHCNYFGHESLASIFARSGFEVLSLTNYFDDQFLGIEARPCDRSKAVVPTVETDLQVGHRIAKFAEHFRERKAEWGKTLSEMAAAGKRVTVWAAGAKTVSFMNFFEAADQIDSVVDINPRKQEMHLPGTGHKILHPDALRERKPDVVIVMNAHYRDEIAAQLESMGLTPEILTA